MAPESLHLQIDRGAGERRLLVIVPAGQDPPKSLPEDAIVVAVSERGFEFMQPGGGDGGVAVGGDWVSATGWKLRSVQESAVDGGLRDETDWGDPELQVQSSSGEVSTKLRLAGGNGHELVVGRAKDCDLALDDDRVSRRHLRIFREDGRHYAEDLFSSSGTFINGERVEGKRRLRHEDRIEVGRTMLRYHSLLDALEGRSEAKEQEPPDAPSSKAGAPSGASELQEEPVSVAAAPTPAQRPWWENAVLLLLVLSLAAVLVMGYLQITGGD